MEIIEEYGRKYDMDDPADSMELIFDANFGLDNDIESIINRIGGQVKKTWDRALKLNWKYTGEAHSLANGIIALVMLDPQKKKHWMRFSKDGNLRFAPTRFTCF